ncbi:response regulator [Candidatus Poribacteria bacterium]|nr:response regulator [Candidatus Poribacteria bacterium]
MAIMGNTRILIVEDKQAVAEHIENQLKSLGYTVLAVVSYGEEAIQKTEETRPDLVLIDMKLEGDMDGIEVAKQMRDRFNIPVVYLTDYADEDLLHRAEITGPFGYMLEPFEERRLYLNIEIALYSHEMERKFREEGQWLSTILKSIGDAVIATDKNGSVKFMNPIAEVLTGWKQEEAFGEDLAEVFDVVTEETRVPTQRHVMKALGKRVTADLAEHTILIARDDKETPIDYSAAPIRDDKENITGVVLVFRDITERKRTEEALAQAYTQGRLEVVDAILHNIGNAINSVTIGIGTIHENLVNNRLTHRLVALADAISAHQDDFSNYVENHPQGQKVAAFIIALASDFTAQDEKLAKTVSRVRDRAEHIADIVRMQKSLGRSSVYRKDIDLRKTIGDAIRVLSDSIRKREIEIDIDCDNAPKELRTQESQFHQMLVNLIKNSIEAIDELGAWGGLNELPLIRIKCYIKLSSFFLEVIDNGIGIQKDKFNLIFSGDYTTKESGSGLGLHSIANFAEGWGGKIYPLSDGIGKGTMMRVMLPLSSVIT